MYYFETVRAGETPVCITLPTLDGGAPAPIVQYYAVVSANSKSDAAVRDFLQCALSTRFQYQLVQKNSALPVNRTMLDQMEEFYRTTGENTDMPYTFLKVTEFPADFVDTYFSRIREMRPGVFMDSNWIFGVSEYTRNRWILGASSEEAACAAEQILDKYQSGSGTSVGK
jgi:ABC-type glycerol-3-phosphate transport system substrate-binding protein